MYIDIAKGIGMLLVIVGHTITYGTGIVYKIIFSFHMPLFFMLSGYIFHPEKYTNIYELAKKKGRDLLVPFLYATLAGLIVTCMIPQFRTDVSFYGIIKSIYTGYVYVFHNGAAWFLLALFWVFMEYELLYKLLMRAKIKLSRDIVIMVISVILLGVFLVYRHFISTLCDISMITRLPLRIDCSFVGLFFFALGHYVANRKCDYNIKLLIISMFVNLVCVILNKGKLDVNACLFGYVPLFYVGAVAGCMAIITLACLLNRLEKKITSHKLMEAFCFIGRNSIYYLCSQMLILRTAIVIINVVFHSDWVLMQENTPYWLSTGLTILAVVCCTLFIGLKNGLMIKKLR